MRILVTGGAGFIGSHIVDAYLAAGHEVVAADDLSTGRMANVNARAEFHPVDLTSSHLRDLFRDRRFDVVSHHAAQVDVRRSVQDPAGDAAINIGGTIRLLELCRQHGVRGVIFSSSAGTIYGEEGPIPTPEDAPQRPVSPYGISKLAGERYVDYYQSVHGIRGIILRYTNVYGPRQDPHGEAGVVAIFCQRLLQGEVPVVYGDGEQTRDFVYVGDVAVANLRALDLILSPPKSPLPTLGGEGAGEGGQETEGLRDSTTSPIPSPSREREDERQSRYFCHGTLGVAGARAAAFNIGTGQETSVNALLGRLAALTGGAVVPRRAPPRAGEQRRSAADPALARNLLGWAPTVSLAEGLGLTLDWFKKHLGSFSGGYPNHGVLGRVSP